MNPGFMSPLIHSWNGIRDLNFRILWRCIGWAEISARFGDGAIRCDTLRYISSSKSYMLSIAPF